jgi:hypothetical protein
MVKNTERMNITSNTNLFMTMATVKEHSLETIFLHLPFHYPRGSRDFFAKRFFHWLVSPLCRSENLSLLQSFKISERYWRLSVPPRSQRHRRSGLHQRKMVVCLISRFTAWFCFLRVTSLVQLTKLDAGTAVSPGNQLGYGQDDTCNQAPACRHF